MTNIGDVEESLSSAGIAYAWRGSEKLKAAGCVVSVDAFDHVKVEPEDPGADPERIRRALRYY